MSPSTDGRTPPLVSVVTPVYDGMPYLERCIESVRAQTFGDWEYVILDNASGDGSRELAASAAARDDRIRLETNPRTLPYAENWNRALGLISPDARYVKVVHADDWIRPDCLSAMVSLAEAHPSVSVVGARVERGDEVMCRWDGAPGPVVDGREVCRLSLLGEIPYVFGSPTSILMRADVVRSLAPLYEETRLEIMGQVLDQDVCYRMLAEGDFGYVPRVLTATREHEDSLTSENEELGRWLPGKLALHRRYGPTYLEPAERQERMEEWLDRYYRFMARMARRRPDRELWTYHLGVLREVGPGFRPGRLAAALAADLVRAVRRRLPEARFIDDHHSEQTSGVK